MRAGFAGRWVLAGDQETVGNEGGQVLFASGYPNEVMMRDGRLDPMVDLIANPFTHAGLTINVRELLDQHAHQGEQKDKATHIITAGRIEL